MNQSRNHNAPEMENLFEKEPMALNDKMLSHENLVRSHDVPRESASSLCQKKSRRNNPFQEKSMYLRKVYIVCDPIFLRYYILNFFFQRRGLFTEDAFPEELTHMGNNVFVGPSIYKGKVTVHIREYAKYGKAYYPTRRGVNFEPWCLNVLATNMTVDEQDLLVLNLELPKNFVVTYKDSHLHSEARSSRRMKKVTSALQLRSGKN
ncbi:uncharacterized protein LOC118203675 [Stegodyphus dumicola]|uniref:uncharacterized protein LOC118203675 n=1 Tax=Stegodyphus dumicola TaxID=202533 RepID=UPI0015AEDE11|nr:uncharacterized protein LOC118203675 [Stegodyphus dumicola]